MLNHSIHDVGSYDLFRNTHAFWWRYLCVYLLLQTKVHHLVIYQFVHIDLRLSRTHFCSARFPLIQVDTIAKERSIGRRFSDQWIFLLLRLLWCHDLAWFHDIHVHAFVRIHLHAVINIPIKEHQNFDAAELNRNTITGFSQLRNLV